ncbi:ferredoxin [Mycobacterium sp. pUA109]|uniref:ferredoxin n=1 Tax=Mycobacterium sp. pUA109 TaxID=3238982 RepID=UPI00351AE450
MKIGIDRNRCEGHGLCVEQAPALFTTDEEGELINHHDGQNLPNHLVGAARGALSACPVAALREVL